MGEKPAMEEAFETKVKKSTDDPEESKTVTSAVSEDKHLDKNRGGGSRNHEKSDDKALQWINGTAFQPTRTHGWILVVVSLMILITIFIIVPSNRSQRLATQALELSKHHDHLKTLFDTDTSLSPETWKNGRPPPNHLHAPTQGVGLGNDESGGTGKTNPAPSKRPPSPSRQATTHGVSTIPNRKSIATNM